MSDFHVYILCNPKKSTLYVGMTNDLSDRLIEHYLERGNRKKFAGRYYCYCLLYYEGHDTAMDAIEREKEIKKWSRAKKEKLIATMNPEWRFLNEEILPWPPEEGVTKRY